ncbi:MAG: cyclic nucleotide-binding and patatin-like phospholipase domain-containing protein, partial [Dehalococcoidia bacterium]
MAGITSSPEGVIGLEHLLSEDDWRDLLSCMDVQHFAPGDHLVLQGAMEPPFFIIGDGVASVVAQGPNGDLRELGRIGAGECAGEMSLLTGDPASANVVALTAVRAHSASQTKLASLDRLRSRVIEALSAILATRLKQANARLLTLSSATTHVLVCGPGAIDALRKLPEAVADTSGERVLIVLLGGHAAVSGLESERVSVRVVAPDEALDLSRILHRAAHEYGEILIFTERPALAQISIDPATMVYVTRAEDARDMPPDVPVTTRVAMMRPAGGTETWTQPSIRRLSDACGRQVVAVLPSGGADDDDGTAIARFARTLTGRQVGLALGAGAAKGLAHLGVLRALAEMKVPIDIVSGCSIGSAIAAGVAAGM